MTTVGPKTEGIKTEALQEAILNSAYFSSIATDELGVIRIFNVGAERMLGYQASDVVGQITPADISDPQELIARAATLSEELGTEITPGFEALVFKASRGIEDIYELTYTRKDGSHFPAIVSVTALRDAAEGIIGYLLIGTDNTAKHEIEVVKARLDEVLREQQFYAHSLIEGIIDALMMTDPQGIITDVNNEMMNLTGHTRSELIGTHCKEFFTDPDSALNAIARVLAENRVSNYELTVRAKSGQETVVSYSASTFHDRHGVLQGVFAAARDVTERKTFEQALLETNSELEHASKMKSEFLATMSHELRTPLNAIIGFSEALKDGLVGTLSSSQLEYTGDIYTSGRHLLSLINDILDLSKVEAGMMTLELETADLNQLLTSSFSIVKETAQSHGVRLELDIEEGIGDLQLDVRKTKQIVYNLLSNAVKFSGLDSIVTLTARIVPRESVGRIEGVWPTQTFSLSRSEYTKFLEIAVQDTGIGISAANMSKLYRAFSQIDSSLSRKFEGTGLGLAMVKQLAELHEGTVAVASYVGVGSRFVAWMPIRPFAEFAGQEAPKEIPLRQVRPPHLGKALLLENNDHTAQLLVALLETEGFEVIHADDAEKALVLATQVPLTLITVDMDIPDDGGWKFMEQIRQLPDLIQIPVIIVTNSSDPNIALANGASAVLQKPIIRKELVQSLSLLGMEPDSSVTRCVLVIDDDPKAVELIAAYLPLSEYTVVRAYGGSEGIALAERLRPDVIILDLMMPEVSGFDVVKSLRRNVRTSNTPIIVVTAKQVTSQDVTELTTGSDMVVAIVEKTSFDRTEFLAGVRRALGRPLEVN